jgi:CheY-like chemotaxis protein
MKNCYDVILMDQRMPEMDGEEAFRIIRGREDGPNAKTPVICLTADAVVGARERYLAKGFDDYLTKPIDSTYLEMMLRKYIPPEKIELVREEEKASSQEQAVSEVGDPAFKILEESGINTAKGLANCAGDEEFYRSILREYLSVAEVKKADLNRYFDSKDFRDYEILIHSLKSTSATIGAEVPYKTAQELEAAARNLDGDFVFMNHGRFLDEYQRVLDAIGKVIEDGGTDDHEFGEDGAMEFLPDP